MKKFFKFLSLFIILLLSGCGDESGSDENGNVQMGGAIQGKPLSLIGEVTTIAGTADAGGWADGIGVNARFLDPYGITTDGKNLYVVDSNSNTIRKIDISTAVVTTIAGSYPHSGSDDGIGSNARFWYPSGMTTDGKNLYCSDGLNNTIRKLVISTGAVTTLAGTPGISGSLDGMGAAARFNFPEGITTDGTNLYVADSNNHTIRKIVISTGVVTTLAGAAGISGASDGTGISARFGLPHDVTTDGKNLYVAEFMNCIVRKIKISTGAVTTLAGNAAIWGSLDGTGTGALFRNPSAITTDGTNLYVAEAGNNTIRKIEISTGVVTTLAGTPLTTGFADGIGSAASFDYPNGITSDGKHLYVSDYFNGTIRKIN